MMPCRRDVIGRQRIGHNPSMDHAPVPLVRGSLRALKIILLTFTGIGRTRMINRTTEGLGPQHFLLGGLFAAILVNVALVSLVLWATG